MQYLLEEVPTNLVAAILYGIISVMAIRIARNNGGKSLVAFFMYLLSNALYLIFETASIILLNATIWKLAQTLVGVSFMSWMVFLDYTFSDELTWKKMVVGASFLALYITWMWHPENIMIVMVDSDTIVFSMQYEMVFHILFDWNINAMTVTMLYWAIKTLKESPPDHVKMANLMLGTSIIMLVSSIMLVLTDFVFESDVTSAIMYATFLGGSFMIAYIIFTHPIIIHLLPYKVYRLIIMSHSGVPYYIKSWSPVEINEVLLTGLFSAIDSMSRGTMNDIKGGEVEEVKFKKAIMISVNKYSPVVIAILASKTSRELRHSLERFSIDFVGSYYKILYDKDGLSRVIKEHPSKVFNQEKMDEMVGVYFKNVPDFISRME